MTICPIAVVVGCRKCPAFRICPVKSVIGDQPKSPPPTEPQEKSAPRKRS